jgi:hypothetical protein
MPLFRDGHVLASSGHGTGTKLLKIAPDSKGVTEVWCNTELDNCHGGFILVGGHIYGSGCRLYHKGLVCVDFSNGKTAWNDKGIGVVSMTCAEGMLYCLNRQGRVSLIEANPKRCNVVSQFNLPREGRDLCLCHPVICGGRLYLRHAKNLFAYDISSAHRK